MLNPILVKLADDMEKEEKGTPKEKAEHEASETPEEEAAEHAEENEEGAAPPPAGGAIDPAKIMDFFAQQGPIDDAAFHAFAEQNGFDIHQAEGVAYKLAQTLMGLLRGGKSAGMDPNQFDPQQIDMGLQIEAEHTDNPIVQKKIVFDHLAEKPDYYSQECMQSEMQAEGGAGMPPEEQPPVSPEEQYQKTAAALEKIANRSCKYKKKVAPLGKDGAMNKYAGGALRALTRVASSPAGKSISAGAGAGVGYRLTRKALRGMKGPKPLPKALRGMVKDL